MTEPLRNDVWKMFVSLGGGGGYGTNGFFKKEPARLIFCEPRVRSRKDWSVAVHIGHDRAGKVARGRTEKLGRLSARQLAQRRDLRLEAEGPMNGT